MYKLSNQAVEDFESIYEYTWRKFGYQQADKYTTEMEQLFLLLEKNALMGRNRSEIKEGTRQYNHRQHAIFYQNADYGHSHNPHFTSANEPNITFQLEELLFLIPALFICAKRFRG